MDNENFELNENSEESPNNSQMVQLNYDNIASLVHNQLSTIQQHESMLFMEIFYACVYVLNNSIYAWSVTQYGQALNAQEVMRMIYQLFETLFNSPIYNEVQKRVQDRMTVDALLQSVQSETKTDDNV